MSAVLAIAVPSIQPYRDFQDLVLTSYVLTVPIFAMCVATVLILCWIAKHFRIQHVYTRVGVFALRNGCLISILGWTFLLFNLTVFIEYIASVNAYWSGHSQFSWRRSWVMWIPTILWLFFSLISFAFLNNKVRTIASDIEYRITKQCPRCGYEILALPTCPECGYSARQDCQKHLSK